MVLILKIAKRITGCVLSVILIFVIYLFLGGKSGLAAAAVMIAVMFIVILFLLRSFLAQPKDLRNISRLLRLVLFFLLAASSLTGISLANHAMYKVMPVHVLTPWEKTYLYHEALLYKSSGGKSRLNYMSSLQHLSNGKINFYFEEADRKTAQNMILHMDGVTRIMTAMTGEFETVPVTVIFYRNPLIFQQNVPNHHFDSLKGMYVPRERMIHFFIGTSESENEEGLLKRFAHEYSHHMLVAYLESHGLDNRHLPRWFEEGAAEYAAVKSVRLRPPFRPLNIIPFKKIHSMSQWENANRNASPHNPYKQSYYAIDEVIQRNGGRTIGSLMLKSANGNFYEKFETAIGMKIEQFQVEFLKKEMEEFQINNAN
ncbi:hypothetical protein ACFFJY_13100 [Fictibacillus aquaticus]|uniref:DUF1570 domain-containing protein n=1 Tax=Fictibacillus aquaticus TaxID=2021314 RepID=A0A235FCW5_9BACL|nr:hypothetical protein [Fictibacillus aquaticus]OYD59166.1 hypothetical protein CGZ90_04520 [Fictibacillus aquaticus]